MFGLNVACISCVGYCLFCECFVLLAVVIVDWLLRGFVCFSDVLFRLVVCYFDNR